MNARRIPVVSTIVVVAAAATMVALGVWQLSRMDEKAEMIQQFGSNASNTQILDVAALDTSKDIYRKVRLDCHTPSNWIAVAGRNRTEQIGYVHRYDCGLLAGDDIEGQQYSKRLLAEIGWSRGPGEVPFAGGTIVGLVAEVGDDLKVVSDEGLAGLQPSARPDPGDLPNNHLAYAGQWFFFALTALLVYGFAVRKKWREQD